MSREILLVPGSHRHADFSDCLKSPSQYRPTVQELSESSENAEINTMRPGMNPKIRQLPLITWLGGPYAILLQLSHPAIASASCAHSRFVIDALSRLRRTAAYIVSLTHGTEREQLLISGMITRQHCFIKNRNRADKGGHEYDARDPELQKWVAATLFKGIMLVDGVFSSSSVFPSSSNSVTQKATRKSWEEALNSDRNAPNFLTKPSIAPEEERPSSWLFAACQYLGIKPPRVAMSRSEKEALLKEARHLATSLDMPPEMWFSSLDDFEFYFEGMITRGLFVSPTKVLLPGNPAVPVSGLAVTSKEMGLNFLYKMKLPIWLFWLPSLMRLLARAWLPDNLRRGFGLSSLDWEQTHTGGFSGPGNNNHGTEIRTDMGLHEGLIWTTVMRWAYIIFIWFVWLVDWLMPMWLENWIIGFMVRDMEFAAGEIERTGRWPM
ncbi:hypothetical protein QBC37DRAFT_429227 [Rhypophila decipiens]|uniref:ER-bound oxygenase mpaB/mpaB'/Rubber oxygenase catalytic domain-containing protein n=1 Tax=Rhypophila decipiens TaxID=261697 RepID=A0AAN7B429_9PEZI|nr:hypothetical protein QBC37DRAFT_429227 [Rhypophila decipiens]